MNKFIRGDLVMVIFSGSLSHKDVAERLGIVPETAGHIGNNGHGAYCFGESITLGIKSNSCDDFYLRMLLDPDRMEDVDK